jgi:NAD(P)-dependent dehydrogenase (short-subunit alcohol dehydrogenase family)
VLVNNVGIAGPTAHPEDITLDDWTTCLRVNLTSHFLFAGAVIPGMKAARSGLIVNISSGSARTGLPMRLPQVVTKGAIRGERINRVVTAKAAAFGVAVAQSEASMLRYVSLRTMVEPEDIAAMILFLAGQGGQKISGQMLGVDGHSEWEE